MFFLDQLDEPQNWMASRFLLRGCDRRYDQECRGSRATWFLTAKCRGCLRAVNAAKGHGKAAMLKGEARQVPPSPPGLLTPSPQEARIVALENEMEHLRSDGVRRLQQIIRLDESVATLTAAVDSATEECVSLRSTVETLRVELASAILNMNRNH